MSKAKLDSDLTPGPGADFNTLTKRDLLTATGGQCVAPASSKRKNPFDGVAPATAKYGPRSAASRVPKIGRICRPMKMNARMLSAKTTVSHTAYAGSRSRAGVFQGEDRAVMTA